jgi:hypothetical protein
MWSCSIPCIASCMRTRMPVIVPFSVLAVETSQRNYLRPMTGEPLEWTREKERLDVEPGEMLLTRTISLAGQTSTSRVFNLLRASSSINPKEGSKSYLITLQDMLCFCHGLRRVLRWCSTLVTHITLRYYECIYY